MTYAPPIHARAERLPQDTITLCFSDVEGSTPMMQRIPERYAEVLVTQRRIVRDAILANRGLVLSAEGEELYSCFPSAMDGVRAAIDAQLATVRYPWPDGAQLRVRIGLHTGTPVWTSEEYVGLDVVRANRVMAAGYGGQVLISGTTYDALGDEREGFDLLDFGQHRLKGIVQLERIYQASAAGLTNAFPPLRTLTQRPATLPIPARPLLGRETELADIQALLARSDVRLVTLTGPGGTGKTRLATEVAAIEATRFTDGVAFVPLAPVREPTGVVQAIAQAMELNAAEDLAGLRAQMRDRNVLLVLDNCEHVMEAVGDAASLLASCPQLRILATSREPLHRAGEREYRVRPLKLPPESASAAEIANSPAVRLFVERASALRPGFAVTEANAGAVARICARIDGLPLYIELVAARSRLLTPTQLLARLDDPLALVARGPRDLPERQQSLESVIGWSYNLLPEDERTVFRHLAVFAGGFTMEAAEAVVPDAFGGAALFDHLEALTAKSLIVLDDAGEQPRFRMLEMLREYGLMQLERSGEQSVARDRHLGYIRDLVRATARVPQAERVATIAHEIANVREALSWSRLTPERATIGLSLASAAGDFWWQRAITEGRRWLGQLSQLADARPGLRTMALFYQAYLASEAGDDLACVAFAERCLEEGRATGGANLAMALNIYSDSLLRLGRTDRAFDAGCQAVQLARDSGNQQAVAMTLWAKGLAAFSLTRYDDARACWLESSEIFSGLGDESLLAQPHLGLADLFLLERDTVAAEANLVRGLSLLRRAEDHPRLPPALAVLARIRLAQGRPAEAAQCLAEAFGSLQGSLSPGSDGTHNAARPLDALAEFCAAKGRWNDAVAFSTSARNASGRSMPKEEIDALLEAARAHLTPEEYRRAETRGEGLRGADAVNAGLEVVRNG